MKRMQGSYSVVIMIDGVIYAFRDPLGIKPFCLGKIEKGYIVASESVAIDALGGKFLRDIKPGELIRMDADGVRCTQIAVAGRRAHCIFEYIYFARADAIIDGVLRVRCAPGYRPETPRRGTGQGGFGLFGTGLRVLPTRLGMQNDPGSRSWRAS